MRKKLVSGLLAATMVASLMVGCGSEDTTETTEATNNDTEAEATEATEDTNEVTDAAAMEAPSADGWTDENKIYVYLWDDDGQKKVQTVIDQLGDLGQYVEIVNFNVGGQSEDYINNVNSGLEGGDKYPSVILADEGIAKQWSESDKTADLASIGITPEMYANAYSYTVDYGNYNGTQKALSWQATPGVFAYRADIASEVLGTDDPTEVGAAISDWDKFMEVAGKMKEAGYKMVSGTNEVKYPILNQRTAPWVNVADDGTETLQLDDTLSKYCDIAKQLYDNDYTNKANQWEGEWAGSMAEGDVFGYFGTTWFVAGNFMGNCPEDAANYGNWRVTTGPESYYWGGTYLMAGAETPNPELTAYFIYMMTCNPDVMYTIAEKTGDFVNNKEANEKLIADGVGANDCLGGQNPVEAFAEAAVSINVQSTYIDGSILSYVDEASKSYNAGEFATTDECIDYIKQQVATNYDYIVQE